MANGFDVVLRSDLTPGEWLSKLSEQIDIDVWKLFSLSGYGGQRPFLGRVVGYEFRVHKRRYWHNPFGPVLFGRVVAANSGALIEAYWSTWKWPRTFVRAWLFFALAISAPILYQGLRALVHGQALREDNLWLNFVVPAVFLAYGLFFPKLGAALSFHERRFILQFLQSELSAKATITRSEERNWKTSLDGRLG
ncbi:MAG TPA: hypothetical protein VMU53_09625 [Candidatus Sulfotelmatobacter sp.]|nr:hypothetical protein [Candidatus Sulfotelmatobacter sp.]